jgi:hypothetical protein
LTANLIKQEIALGLPFSLYFRYHYFSKTSTNTLPVVSSPNKIG